MMFKDAPPPPTHPPTPSPTSAAKVLHNLVDEWYPGVEMWQNRVDTHGAEIYLPGSTMGPFIEAVE